MDESLQFLIGLAILVVAWGIYNWLSNLGRGKCDHDEVDDAA